MSSENHQAPAPGGLSQTFTAALAAALTCGVLFGLFDAVMADFQLWPPEGFVGYLGCYSAAVMSYSLLFLALLLPTGLLLHPVLRKQDGARRLGRLMMLGLAAGLFAELYWWSRPFLFYGHSSVSPERLAVAAGIGVLSIGLAWIFARLLVRMPRTAHLALRIFGLVAIVGGALFARAEQNAIEGRGSLNERNRDLPNVLLVIVDALRADHLAAYGNDRVQTPNIDALAARGVLFENCFAQAPYTLTSFGSILTGKYPRRHGLVAQEPGAQMKPNVTLPYHLKTARIKDSEQRLQDGDYAAGTFMTGAVSHGSGLARGFDAYSEALMGHDLVQIDSQWSHFRSELLLWVFKNKLQQRVDSSLVVTTARGWLREHQGKRWMAMVHLYSTHTPYDPPKGFQDPYVDPTYSGPFRSFYAEHRYALERGEYEPNEADVQRIRDLYLAGAAQADAQIGELMAELEELGMLQDTLVILTSDHGEDLGEWRAVGPKGSTDEMRVWEHNHMWQTNLRVPMILANTRLLPHGKRVEELIESVDLLPTICDLLDLELPTEDGVLEVDGRSLVPLMLGTQRGEQSDFTPKPYTFSENNWFFSIQSLESKLIVPRSMLMEDDFEQLFDTNYWVRFYDLRSGAGEEVNTLDRDNPRVRELWRALWEYNASMPEAEYYQTERDLEQIELFNALGYGNSIDPETLLKGKSGARGSGQGQQGEGDTSE